MARRIATEPEGLEAEIERLQRNLEIAVPRSESLVAEASGITPPTPVKWAVIKRADWAEANIAGMSKMIAPITDRFSARLDAMPAPARLAQRGLVSAEVGAMVGYISRRVLGQYDLLMAEEADSGIVVPRWRRRRHPTQGAALYFVGANMVETEKRLKFVPEDFALWVAVHEVTHRFQFAGVPWLRDRFFGLIQRYLESVEMDAKTFMTRLVSAGRKLVSRSVPVEEKSAVYLFASDEQRAVLDEVQALMAVVEGHGNYVMDRVGAEVIPSFHRMRESFDRRRDQSTRVQRIVNQAIGLDMKMRQYELGQRFCEAVVARGGEQALAHLWSAPDNMPSLAELNAPESWVTRVA